jgi:membrane fusion protein (multidrug efflux system)
LYSQEEQASLDELRIATENARRQYERFLPLFQRGDVSQSILDERKQDLDLARAKEAVMKARLAKLTIVAPFAGQLGVRQISEGALLTQGTVVTQLQDLTELKLDFHVPSRFLKELKEGLEVAATTDAYPGQIFKGVIETVLPQVDRVTRTIQVRAKLDNASGALLPGLLMKVQLQQTPRTALFMPETAVVPMADKQFVYVLKEDENNLFKLMRRQVQLGSREPGWVEVVSGVKAGEWVVSQGALKVRPGQLVKKLEQLNRKSDFADQGDAL